MSLVYLTYHNENIYDVEREDMIMSASGSKRETIASTSSAKIGSVASRKSIPPAKKETKIVKFHVGLRTSLGQEQKQKQIVLQKDGVRLLTPSKKFEHRTMGCAKTPVDPPCAYLRKNEGIKWRREKDHECVKSEGLPPIPRLAECDKKEPTKYPDFIRRNIKCADSLVPCRPPPRYVDTPYGTRHNLVNSGMLPQFICSKDFGKVPVYIKKTKQMLEAARDVCSKHQQRLIELCAGTKKNKSGPMTVSTIQAAAVPRPPTEMPGVRVMDPEERKEILIGLKKHLVEMTKQYQSMSLLIDSVAKRQRKGKLESDLRQVEQDIMMLETSPIIYVSKF